MSQKPCPGTAVHQAATGSGFHCGRGKNGKRRQGSASVKHVRSISARELGLNFEATTFERRHPFGITAMI
jgi:hypothetical protein